MINNREGMVEIGGGGGGGGRPNQTEANERVNGRKNGLSWEKGKKQVKTSDSLHHKSMGGDDGGLRRRSPRISALDACKQNHQYDEQTQLSRTRTCRIKRKFDDAPKFTALSKLAKQVWKGRDSSQNANLSTDCMQWRSTPDLEMVKQNQKQDGDHAIKSGKASIMPAKHILELVLDALQRRDTYEIFAEPVDPDEVEDYYEIIKEPMDFGTMRAKLHEGMYENLEQFEHDVFLIPENAMHFNSSATIYFRQARAIHELAKKAFNALKTDPENFMLEFSGTRRRSMRRALSDMKSANVDSNVSSKAKLHSPSTSTFRRSCKKNPGCTGMTQSDLITGLRDGRLTSSQVADRRFTYWTCINNDNDSVDSISYTTSDSLVLMNQGEINYKDSLMSFVKGLGPIAEKVARRKLLPQIEPKSQIPAAKERKSDTWDANAFRTFRDFAAGRCPNLKASNIIDLTEDGEEAKGGNRRVDYGSAGKEKSDCGRAGKEKIDSHRRVNAIGKQDGVARNRKSNEMGRSCTELNSSSGSRSNNTSLRDAAGKSDDNVRPVILALENTHSNAGESKLRNKKSCIKWSVGVKKGQTNELCGVGGQKEGNKSMRLMSQFTFDLPFLKARLNEMNVGGGEVKRATSFERGGGGGVERALNCTQQAESIVMKPFISRPSSFNKLDTTNLALEL
ncbi:UNVERIFIED_CONTAM: hypothetical protein Slati_1643800 [Sesamum latifolium]|uniref:Bromo domain-containing protein n=1 Tax=Sesamum latifolium TaxID=2727402 RepID=A0AAW2X9Z9_9LAMI